MCKYEDKEGSLTLAWPPVYENENTGFKPIVYWESDEVYPAILAKATLHNQCPQNQTRIRNQWKELTLTIYCFQEENIM